MHCRSGTTRTTCRPTQLIRRKIHSIGLVWIPLLFPLRSSTPIKKALNVPHIYFIQRSDTGRLYVLPQKWSKRFRITCSLWWDIILWDLYWTIPIGTGDFRLSRTNVDPQARRPSSIFKWTWILNRSDAKVFAVTRHNPLWASSFQAQQNLNNLKETLYSEKNLIKTSIRYDSWFAPGHIIPCYLFI